MVVRVKSAAQYVDPGYLVFAQDSTLVARHFDAATGAISGDPIAIADRVNFFLSTGAAQFSASRAGVMAYLAQRNESSIVSFDRSGRELAEVRPRGDYFSLRVTGDGSELFRHHAGRAVHGRGSAPVCRRTAADGDRGLASAGEEPAMIALASFVGLP